jgi:predicted secreted protein
MPLLTGIMVYVLVWWMMFFCVLPLNIQSIIKPTDGSMPGAPVNPDLKRKAILTTIISIFVWLAIYGLIKANLISFHDIAARMSM